jgi:hypothetical protein
MCVQCTSRMTAWLLLGVCAVHLKNDEMRSRSVCRLELSLMYCKGSISKSEARDVIFIMCYKLLS